LISSFSPSLSSPPISTLFPYTTLFRSRDNFTTELVDTKGLIEALRLVKTESEIDIIQDAASVADQAFEHILTFIEPGVTEIEVANELEFYMRKLGDTSSSFDIIVASGYRSALPHGVASSKVIENGE